MKMHLDCVPCIVSQALRIARLATRDPQAHRQVLEGVLRELDGMDVGITPFELGQVPQRVVGQVTGDADPYAAIRRESNAQAMELYPEMKRIVREAADPLLAAAKVAVAGNIIDFGVADEGFDVEGTLERVLAAPFARDDFAQFSAALDDAETVLYLADNAGEIVFDRVLMEELPVERITCAVKSVPFINDAMLADAREVGIEEVAEVIEIPLFPSRNEALEQEWSKADMIISKGQANYESYSEAEGPLFFLLIAKCDFTAADTGVQKGEAVLLRSRA